jgi:hypothetical protein
MINANNVIGSHDVVLITLDTLRYDVAQELWQKGRTPNLCRVLPATGWERRHTPGTFTFAAHTAFFAGFLPTPAAPLPSGEKHARLFAARFGGSESTTEQTCVFDAPDIASGLAGRGYHTACIGGTGFFNLQTPLGRVLPQLFNEYHWSPELGVTNSRSTEHQVALARRILENRSRSERVFLFINVSAIHQPNCMYVPDAKADSLQTHAAALEYVDRELGRFFDVLQRRAPALVVVCSDHGTAYGEDGYWGHRVAHPSVWEVPYAEFLLPEIEG